MKPVKSAGKKRSINENGDAIPSPTRTSLAILNKGNGGRPKSATKRPKKSLQYFVICCKLDGFMFRVESATITIKQF